MMIFCASTGKDVCVGLHKRGAPLGLQLSEEREKVRRYPQRNMAAIASQLRNYKEPGKEQLTHLFFALPNADGKPPDESYANLESLDINAVFSLGAPGQEDSYVSAASNLSFSRFL